MILCWREGYQWRKVKFQNLGKIGNLFIWSEKDYNATLFPHQLISPIAVNLSTGKPLVAGETLNLISGINSIHLIRQEAFTQLINHSFNKCINFYASNKLSNQSMEFLIFVMNILLEI